MIFKILGFVTHWFPCSRASLNTGVTGTRSSPQRPVSEDAHSVAMPAISSLALVRYMSLCRLRNPSPQDTEHSDHAPVSHLRTKTTGA